MNTLTLKLLGNTISVQLQPSQVHNGYYDTDRFRPVSIKPLLYNPLVGNDPPQEEKEFIGDITYQVNILNNYKELTDATILVALKSSCQNHISKYGRLVTSDLHTYIDCALHILSAATNLSILQLEDVYEKFRKQLMLLYKDYIFIPNGFGGIVKFN